MKTGGGFTSIFVLILTFVLILSATTGCGEKSRGDYLAYERQEGSYLADASYNQTDYRLRIRTGTAPRVEILSPATLSGYVFVLSNGEIVVRTEDFEEIYPGEGLVSHVFRFFTLSEGDFLTTSHEKISGEAVNIVTYADGITLYLSHDNRPLKFTDGECSLVITEKEDSGGA
ncbi:MAG: hypothetical protein ACI3XR_03495 [Eubacteriales bacterium]